ncbi:MAG: GH25 family lysozyme [Actinomycetota bacterium]
MRPRTRRVRPFLACLLAAGLAVGMLAPATPASAAKGLPGIDLSSYEPTVNWTKVGDGPKRFLIMRASHGDEADTSYDSHRAGAASIGMAFGAYHYATPRGGRADAIEQANFFLANATPASGDLLPVLDMEDAGGLSDGRLADWIAVWLNRVRRATGVRPMIYTSPSFWIERVGNTRRFANHGYRLWIAHWQVRNPWVPAGNWGGKGWTFWQWSACGDVNGIPGCIDMDRYAGDNLHKVMIP